MLLIPKRFIPFDIASSSIQPSRGYEARNDLVASLKSIFLTESAIISPHFLFAQLCMSDYVSPNPAKVSAPVQLPTGAKFWQQFQESDVLQVSDLWNPLSPDDSITVFH